MPTRSEMDESARPADQRTETATEAPPKKKSKSERARSVRSELQAQVTGQPVAAPAPEPAPLTRADRIRAARELLEAELAKHPIPATETERRAPPPAWTEGAPIEFLRTTRTEAREMLRELEEIRAAFDGASPVESEAPAVRPPAVEVVCDPRGRAGTTVRGEESPYLDERMDGARSAAADLGKALEEIAERSGKLRTTVASLEGELDRAHKEMRFIRGESAPTPPVPLTAHPAATSSEAATRPASRPRLRPSQAPPATAPSPSFAEYTTDRYNRSVGVLAQKRRQIGATMLGLAAAISAVLLTLTLLFHEPTPPLALAGLPVVWMIPVPFFVVSFRGTQRVLRQNRMFVEGEL